MKTRPRCGRCRSATRRRERLDALDAQDVRLDPFDVGAERDEEAAQVLHVRLARRVADHGLSRREHRGHDRVLRRHDARLVEEDVLAAQAVGALTSKRGPISTSAPSTANAWMCGSSRRRPITSPPGGGTLTAPRRDSSGPASRNEARIRLHSSSSSSRLPRWPRDPNLVRARPFDLGPDVREQRDHRVDVADARDVRQRDALVRQQARGEDRQCAVLVSGSAHRPGQACAALDHEGLHQCVCDGGHCHELALRSQFCSGRRLSYPCAWIRHGTGPGRR